jgi:tetratricopeptide (TPR) repeat protein
VTPEFYVSVQNFYEAEELVGQYEIGASFRVDGNGETARRIGLNDELSPRVAVLSRIAVGLARYYLHHFEKALETFKDAREIEGVEGRGIDQVLYLLMGNAAGKMMDLESSEIYHRASLLIDPEYARAHIGLAGVYYIRALEKFRETENPEDIDVSWLYEAIATYDKALSAANKPAHSDVTAKVKFGLGQCYMMLVYVGEEEFFDPAIENFQAVIAEYDGGANPRMRERAAESHGRLGLIYTLSGHEDLALRHYRKASSLLGSYPERQSVYHDRIQSLQSGLNASYRKEK